MGDDRAQFSSRRFFLQQLMATTALVVSGPAFAQHSHGAPAAGKSPTRPRLAAPQSVVTPPAGPGFVDPPPISVGRDNTFALKASFESANVGTKQVFVRRYRDPNNSDPSPPLVGPTITIGSNGKQQNLSVTLTNALPLETDAQPTGDVTQSVVPDTPHGFNTTNLHTHGLHVAPLQDNVYLELQPAINGPGTACTPTVGDQAWVCNGSFTYSYNFGANGASALPAGTYWYHPHKHGSVGVQVSSGMAGAIVVTGDLDQIAGVKGLPEHTMLIQYIPFAPDKLGVLTVSPDNFYGTEPANVNTLLSINGQINPTVSMKYGEIQRWRIVNATSEQFFYLQVVANGSGSPPPPNLFVIAVDGVPLTTSTTGLSVPFALTPPVAAPTTFADAVLNEIAVLAPGQRLDLLVQASPTAAADASYSLNAMSWTNTGAGQTIATIAVSDSIKPPNPLPSSSLFDQTLTRPPLPASGSWPKQPTQVIQFGFLAAGNGAGAAVSPSGSATSLFAASPFTLPQPQRGQQSAVPAQIQLKLGAVDLWQVSSDPQWGFGPHAFHIHINSFMMTQRYGVDISAAQIWRDTVRIDQATLGGVQFVSHQVDYTGDFVMHCHVLEHEDSGMMWSVSVS